MLQSFRNKGFTKSYILFIKSDQKIKRKFAEMHLNAHMTEFLRESNYKSAIFCKVVSS